MISPANSSDRPHRPGLDAGQPRPPMRRPLPPSDEISVAGAAFLRSQLVRQPEVRPEVVARARALAADPNYPSIDIARRVAEQILAAPDLSEIE